MSEFYKISGINHDRFVGIARNDGKAYDFYIMNIDGYRPPVTGIEKQACLDAGKRYYDDCFKTGDFGLEEVTQQELKKYFNEYILNWE